MSADLKRRQNRAAQAKRRNSGTSYKTDAENIGLLLLWEADELSEGQIASALRIDRVTLRSMRARAIAVAQEFYESLTPNPKVSGAPDKEQGK